MASNSTIEQIVEQIRHAVYGYEVRENIADGIWKCYEDFGVDTLHKSQVKNNLTTTTDGYVLDARQGKTLNDKFSSYLPKSEVINTLTETSAGKALDARQGKALNDKFSNYVTVSQIGSTDDYQMVVKGV